jgi:hypothetical protein
MQEKYLDTELPITFWLGARLHQAIHNLVGLCGENIQTLFRHISLWQGPASIRPYLISLFNVLGGDMRTQCWHISFWQGQAPSGSTPSQWSMQGKYSGTVLAKKLLRGFIRQHTLSGNIQTQSWHIINQSMR